MAGNEIIGFSREDANTLIEVADAFNSEPTKRGVAQSRRRTPITRPTQYVRVTSLSTNTEIGVAAYPGVRVEHDARANTWTDRDSVYVLFANGVAPTSTSTRFHAKATGVHPTNDRLIYAAYDVSVSAAAFSGAAMYTPSTASIANNTPTNLDISSASGYDTDSYNSTVTRFTPPVSDGYYAFGGSISWDANATGYRQLNIHASGGTALAISMIDGNATAGIPTRQSVSGEARLGPVGFTYIQFEATQTSGANLNCTPYNCWISKIG